MASNLEREREKSERKRAQHNTKPGGFRNVPGKLHATRTPSPPPSPALTMEAPGAGAKRFSLFPRKSGMTKCVMVPVQEHQWERQFEPGSV